MATPSKIYMDACCLIESLKGDAGISDPTRAPCLDMLRRLLTAARDEKLVIFTSLLTVSEVIKVGDQPVDVDLKKKIERMIFSGRDGLTTVGLSPAIVLKSRDLAWEEGLLTVKPADRLHLASALVAGATEFLSWDNRLGKKMKKNDIKGVRLVAPSDTGELPADYAIDDIFKN